MKVLLVNPPAAEKKRLIREGRCTQESSIWTTLWPPLTLATIAALLEKNGHELRVMDCAASGMDTGQLLDEVIVFGPSLIILSTATASIESDLALIGEAKKALDGRVVIAALGTHVSVLAKECLAQGPALDCVIRNEPELTSLEITSAIALKKSFAGILGLSFRDASGEIVHNPDRPFIKDLDELPMPAWHLIDRNLYRLPLKGRPFVMINPARGCPYSCTFCTSNIYYGTKLRARSIGSVLKELSYIKNNFKIEDVFFWSDTYTLNKEYVKDLCSEIIKSKLNISWVANSRVDTIDTATLRLMKDAGCWMISFGIESGSQEVLDMAKKGANIQQAADAVRMAREAGLLVAGHFIFGLPGETENTIKATIGFMNRLDLDLAQVYSAVPYPGTELHHMAERSGWIKDAEWGNFRQNSALMELPTIQTEEVQRWVKKAVRTFYLSPKSAGRFMRLMRAANKRYVAKTLIEFVKRFL